MEQKTKDILDLIEYRGVKIKNKADVLQYLEKHPELISALLLAIESSMVEFENPELILSKEHDLEINHNYLRLCIRLDAYESNFLEKIRKITNTYFYKLKYSKGWFIVTSDFNKKTSPTN